MMLSVGERLRQNRLEKNLTLEQASQATRVRVHYLEALERDDLEALPSRVQAKGFLRLYADFLGLPVEEVLAQWEGKPLPMSAEAVPPPTKAEPVQAPEPMPAPVEPSPPHLEPEPSAPTGIAPAVSSAGASSSAILLKEIGQDLRRKREMLGFSIANVEEFTHIRARYLEALENGQLEQLPSPVQGRGMLQNYAEFLRLDSEDLLNRFAEALQQRRIEQTIRTASPSAPRAKPISNVKRWVTPDLLIGGGLILALFFFVAWTASRITAERTRTAQATLPSISEVLLTTPSPTPGAPALPATPVPQETLGEGESTPIPEPVNAPAGTSNPTVAPISNAPVQVYLIARQRAFLRVIVDGKVTFNGRTIPGNAYPFSAEKSIEVICGNAAALQIFYNQQDLGVLGERGQPLRLSFTQQGILTPTPLPTATPTATPQVTPTPTPTPMLATPTITPFIP
ncbi:MULTISPECIES: RodZ domain-containing protein [Anaerolinea]|uniref:RodZ domain-containing protein n=1 Tax=Anaerolinea TaxID=233189 RepID=UPI0026391019|nr:RodZ domain-containing protein [Anaerolinea thermophila]